jgi:hypothetical protein
MVDDPFKDTNEQALWEEYRDEPRMKEALEDLGELLRTFVGTQKITRSSVEKAMEIITKHQHWCKEQGIKFPDMTLLALPTVRKIRVHPRDLDQAAKEMIVVNLVREFGESLPIEELVWAVQAAWPGFKARGPLERKLAGG